VEVVALPPPGTEEKEEEEEEDEEWDESVDEDEEEGEEGQEGSGKRKRAEPEREPPCEAEKQATLEYVMHDLPLQLYTELMATFPDSYGP
jgi:hypothetical protein